MDAHQHTPHARKPRDAVSEVVEYLAGRSVPCPRCNYDLRDNKTARCPECSEPLQLKIASQRVRFGWLVLAFVPGCFSGVAAVFVLVPIIGTLWAGGAIGRGLPWPVAGADAFGFLSAASVVFMYRHRHHVLAMSDRRQKMFACGVWGLHVLAFGLFLLGMWLWA